MKKVQLILLVVLTVSFASLKAQDLKGFSSAKTMTFFGVDYSQTYYIGVDGFKDVEKVATYYPEVWNSLFRKETKKFGLKKYLYKDEVFNYSKVIEDVNSKITEEDVKLRLGNNFDQSNILSIEKAEKIALSYKLNSTNYKYGAVVFASEYNKNKNIGSYILVVLNLENNTVAYTNAFKGKAKGFGFRNFWAGSYYSALKSLNKTYKNEVKSL